MYSVVAVIHLCLQCQKLASNLRTSFLASISSTSSTRNSHHVHSAKVLVFNDLHWHRFRPPSATVVSDEPFLHGTGTLRCLQKEIATYRHWSVLVARPRQCLTLSNPVPWQNWMAAYLGYTLRMKTLFHGWPVMVHDTRTRRRRSH